MKDRWLTERGTEKSGVLQRLGVGRRRKMKNKTNKNENEKERAR